VHAKKFGRRYPDENHPDQIAPLDRIVYPQTERWLKQEFREDYGGTYRAQDS
jgi:hypothetical protein